MSPSERYAEGLRQWRGARNWQARLNYRDSLRRDRRHADLFADPDQGMTPDERRQIAVLRQFGARGR